MGIEQMVRLKAAVASMESRAAVGDDFFETDKNFPRTFFELLDSQLLSNPPGALRDAYCTLHISIGIGIKDESNLHLAKTTQASRDPFEAVKAGNKSLASELLNRHFDGFREQLASLLSGRI